MDITSQDVADFDYRNKILRESLTFRSKPVQTIKCFNSAFYKFSITTMKWFISHPIFLYIIIPTVVTWIVARCFDGDHNDVLNSIWFWSEYIVWWVGLGVLSSIGKYSCSCSVVVV